MTKGNIKKITVQEFLLGYDIFNNINFFMTFNISLINLNKIEKNYLESELLNIESISKTKFKIPVSLKLVSLTTTNFIFTITMNHKEISLQDIFENIDEVLLQLFSDKQISRLTIKPLSFSFLQSNIFALQLIRNINTTDDTYTLNINSLDYRYQFSFKTQIKNNNINVVHVIFNDILSNLDLLKKEAYFKNYKLYTELGEITINLADLQPTAKRIKEKKFLSLIQSVDVCEELFETIPKIEHNNLQIISINWSTDLFVFIFAVDLNHSSDIIRNHFNKLNSRIFETIGLHNVFGFSKRADNTYLISVKIYDDNLDFNRIISILNIIFSFLNIDYLFNYTPEVLKASMKYYKLKIISFMYIYNNDILMPIITATKEDDTTAILCIKNTSNSKKIYNRELFYAFFTILLPNFHNFSEMHTEFVSITDNLSCVSVKDIDNPELRTSINDSIIDNKEVLQETFNYRELNN